MEDNTETTLQPGPYLNQLKQQHVLLFHGTDYACLVKLDSQGDPYFVHEYSPGNLTGDTPMDHWPEWWPFQDASLPERAPQVGDWVVSERFPSSPPMLIAGNRFGRWQMVWQTGVTRSEVSLKDFTVVPAPEGVEA